MRLDISETFGLPAPFQLEAGSSAVGSGTPALAPRLDHASQPRPVGTGSDVAASESQ
ncbi:choice-of-anchor Q domain-containing protein [Sorangium sp. So ce1182]|uniref:choice-of-anchor Q domain-containing protein n=1 Tax=Sorangium sp. So ce1182 TaxID=3133334 RepID=UPI003F5EF7ED